jgi:processive 1,2-diacylglycerol beta-glucosyltransferase
MFSKVAILSTSVGAGHTRAAEALERAFLDLGAARQVRHIDALKYANRMYASLYVKANSYMVHRMPVVAGWLYDALDKPWKSERQRVAFDRLNTRPLVRMLQDYQPEIVVCTHFLPAGVLSSLTPSDRPTPRQVTVITDLDVHAIWLSRSCEHYFVALDESRERLKAFGIAAERISVTGIPVDPAFALPKNKSAICDKHGLLENCPTILVSAGRLRRDPLERVMHSLMSLRCNAQIIVVCGGNEDLRKRVSQDVSRLSVDALVTFKIVGYTRDMDELMAVSDIMVGRPGGLTTAEALASGLACVIVKPIPGQEERNADHLLEAGAAIRCNDLSLLTYKIERLLDDPTRLDFMKQNAARMGRPRSALDVVDTLVRLRANR